MTVSEAIAKVVNGKHIAIISNEFDFEKYKPSKKKENFSFIVRVDKPELSLRKVFTGKAKEKLRKVRKTCIYLEKILHHYKPDIVIIYSDEHILSRLLLAHSKTVMLLIEDGLVAYRISSFIGYLKRRIFERIRNFFWQLIVKQKADKWFGYAHNKKIDIYFRSFEFSNKRKTFITEKILGYPIFAAATQVLAERSKRVVSKEKALFFVGQDIYMKDRNLRNKYLLLLERIYLRLRKNIDYFIYLPHPTEKLEKTLLESLGYLIKNTSEISEATILSSNYSKKIVVGVHSTCLVNISNLGIPTISIAKFFNIDLEKLFQSTIIEKINLPSNLDEFTYFSNSALKTTNSNIQDLSNNMKVNFIKDFSILNDYLRNIKK